jgi:hypothetical protein
MFSAGTLVFSGALSGYPLILLTPALFRLRRKPAACCGVTASIRARLKSLYDCQLLSIQIVLDTINLNHYQFHKILERFLLFIKNENTELPKPQEVLPASSLHFASITDGFRGLRNL